MIRNGLIDIVMIDQDSVAIVMMNKFRIIIDRIHVLCNRIRDIRVLDQWDRQRNRATASFGGLSARTLGSIERATGSGESQRHSPSVAVVSLAIGSGSDESRLIVFQG